MNNIKKVQDDDGHWYWIPIELVKEFDSDLEEISGVDYMDAPDKFDEFIDKYDKYRTGGSPDIMPRYFADK